MGTDSTRRAQPILARRLGTGDAMLIGLASMIGAGVFTVFAPAAQAAGAGLLIGLGIAAVVALANATSSAQLAAVYPTSGGTYVYGRERLGPWWGFGAGWAFVIGKTASCAAMALAVAEYAAPEAWRRPVALATVIVLAALNYRGITKTMRAARVIVVAVLGVLVLVLAATLGAGDPDPANLAGWATPSAGWYGVLQSAGLLFFAFAGYARIATLGEEVRDPTRTIPRAILGALAVAVGLYALVAIALLTVLGPDGVASSAAPLAAAVDVGPWPAAVPIVRAGAAVAALGALLALLTGVGRTTLAMARGGDLPGWLAAVHPRYLVPHHAEVAIAVVIGVLVLTVDLRDAIGFSSFGVLLYYLIANLSAWTQTGADRRYPRWLQGLGVLGCAVLVATLPPSTIGIGIGVLVVGVAYRVLRQRVLGRPRGTA
jgi:APA family basic amino acid/polyamine antiporter